MTITLDLSPEIEKRLGERAAQRGQAVDEYLYTLIERDVAPHAEMPFDELLAPVREDFARSGMSEAQSEELFVDARESVWREQQSGHDAPAVSGARAAGAAREGLSNRP